MRSNLAHLSTKHEFSHASQGICIPSNIYLRVSFGETVVCNPKRFVISTKTMLLRDHAFIGLLKIVIRHAGDVFNGHPFDPNLVDPGVVFFWNSIRIGAIYFKHLLDALLGFPANLDETRVSIDLLVQIGFQFLFLRRNIRWESNYEITCQRFFDTLKVITIQFPSAMHKQTGDLMLDQPVN